MPRRLAAILAVAATGCGASAEFVAAERDALVYGSDDRQEVYESPPAGRELALSTAVLMTPPAVEQVFDPSTAPTSGERNMLCPEERFAEQPSLAFCTGVLVDFDLVLTAAHCARQLEMTELRVVFGYYYEASEQLATTRDDVYRVVSIPALEADPETSTPRIDYAWLRLERAVRAPFVPVAGFRTGLPDLSQSLTVLSAGNGSPLKVDSGATILEPRPDEHDFFVADSDTFRGSSGGPAFDAQGMLLGTLSRGKDDFEQTADQCNATIHDDESDADEQYAYASATVEGLCARSSSSLCRAECGDPCGALPWPKPVVAGGGCSLTPNAPRGTSGLGLLALAWLVRSRRRRGSEPSFAQPAKLNRSPRASAGRAGG